MSNLCYRDITAEEEAIIPLPNEWIRVIKFSAKPLANQSSQPLQQQKLKVFKNIKTGKESFEHPIIAEALKISRKLPVPVGWSLIEEQFEGKLERYFYNSDTQCSLWDPPSLRQCVAECLIRHGFDLNSIGVDFTAENEISQHPEYTPVPTEIPPTLSNTATLANPIINFYPSKIEMLPESMDLGVEEEEEEQEQEVSEESEDGEIPLPDSPPPPSPIEIIPEEKSFASRAERNWESLLQDYREPILMFTEKISHRVKDGTQPPITSSGINILREDIITANERIHHLLIKLRSSLANQAGLACEYVYGDEEEKSFDPETQTSNNIIALGSDIVTIIRQNPHYAILALAYCNGISSTAMIQAAFTLVHRLLHPFSTDSSLTTALLLQSINYQLEEMAKVEDLFTHEDSKLIISRCLFVYDLKEAMDWNPLTSPMPCIPNTSTETVFTSLMRAYSVRRDVTAYFRAIWKTVLPAIVSLMDWQEDLSSPFLFVNIITVAYRLLDHTFNEKAMTVFPTSATAIARAIFEISGQETMITCLFNLLILPNLIKIITGDHDSLENEDVYRMESVGKLINKYFDRSWWCVQTADVMNNNTAKHAKPKDPKALLQVNQANPDSKILTIMKAFVWTVWRLFSSAGYMTDEKITALTIPEFLRTYWPMATMNFTSYKDSKLRNLLSRLKRKISLGIHWLNHMPLDIQGSRYLGVDQEQYYQHLPSPVAGADHAKHEDPINTAEAHELLDRRISYLIFKPNEMLNLTVISRYELSGLLSDIGCAMDEQPVSSQNQNDQHQLQEQHHLYESIAKLLSIFSQQEQSHESECEEEQKEEFFQLVFLYSHSLERTNPEHEVEDNNTIQHEYQQLIKGLSLCNRYEDTLIHLLEKFSKNITSNIYELLEETQRTDVKRQWYYEPEFDIEFAVSHVKIAEKHTVQSRNRSANPNFGLKKDAYAPIFPLFSQFNPQDHHPNFKSLASLQDDIRASYRFGSSHASAHVGTSMARKVVLPAKLRSDQVKVTTLPAERIRDREYAGSEASNRSNLTSRRSVYTEATVAKDASILAPTHSFLHQQYRKPNLTLKNVDGLETMNYQDKDKSFMHSMRTHEVIPTEEFQMRYFRRKKSQSKYEDRSLNNSGMTSRRRLDGPSSSPQSYHPVAQPKPFPAHLRYLIRHEEDGDVDYEAGSERPSSDVAEDAHYSHSRQRQQQRRARNNSEEYDQQDQPNHHGHDDSKFFKDLISDYKSTIEVLQKKRTNDNNTTMNASQQYSYTTRNTMRSDSPSRSIADNPYLFVRTRSPRMPTPPFDGRSHQNNLFSPTQSVMNRFSDEPVVTEEFMHDLGKGYAPELRKYAPYDSAVIHTEPFVPTRQKFYPPTGLRVSKVPEFLSADDNGGWSSRESSPYRRRSRSSSPGTRSRSGTGSYAKPTIASTHQLSERALSIQRLREGMDSMYEYSTTDPVVPQNVDQQEDNSVYEGQHEVSQLDDRLLDQVNGIMSPEVAAPAIKSPQSQQHLREETQSSSSTTSSLLSNGSMSVTSPVRLNAPHKLSDSPMNYSVNSSNLNYTRTSKKFTFAEAVQSASREAAAEQTTKKLSTAKDSSYSISFSPTNSGAPTAEHARLDLENDRLEAAANAYFAANSGYFDEDDEDDDMFNNENLHHYLEYIATTETTAEDDSEEKAKKQRIPVMKRKSVIADMNENKEMFLTGFIATKHGRSGQPKRKQIIFDESSKCIGWNDLSTRRRSSISMMFAPRNKGPSNIPIDEITEVRKGIQTDVLLKAGLIDPFCCLSIVTNERTLDLMLDSQAERDRALRGMKALLINHPKVKFL